MRSHTPSLLICASLLFAAVPAFSAEHAHDKKAAPQSESAVIAKARAEYPMTKCLVSDEDLGSMGEAIPYVHREAGKPDRVVFFCCEGCTDDFKADPAKFLKKLDAAAKNKPAAAKQRAAKDKK
jgi:hypothetical protein